MTVSGVAPPSTAALANVAASQGADAGSGVNANADKAPDAAQVRQFDGLMQASHTGTGVQSMTPTVPSQQTQQAQRTPPVSADVRMTPADANHSSLVERLRTFTSDLDTRYSGLQKHQEQMLTSMSQNSNDPLMSMAQAMDFQWSATTTISEYQLSLAVAQATNGLTHSILKNQE
ncbi:hypothetical protein G3N95_11725 [Paraburkholderia sp. Tr-20389]|uniref:hypothetical protein n=1 Tax=Paraburkholderia sp. Tr-20389 TaxID=2703903 RepID=UPI00197E7511|nr:hypothetical protein [Paraburkholderia sp. Tr-20389]MBN3753610.1 hypothetical protein [Paraburkholderia sp. Tr-20389]